MATPLTSGGLFFSSSPFQRDDNDLNKEVELTFGKAQQTTTIDPDLNLIFLQNEIVLTSLLERRISLITSRSQDWKDGQVTVFDKVLLKLTRNGKGLNSPAVISYFCKEFLGILDQADTDEKRTILSDSVAASVALSPLENRIGSFSESLEQKNLAQQNRSAPEGGLIADYENAVIAELASELEPITGRLWNVYTHAKHEFTMSNGLRKQESAKFLRDTAENLLHRLQDMSVDTRLSDEVGLTLQSAAVVTDSLHGGKKRKFELNSEAPDREKRRKRRDSRELFLGRSRSVDRYKFKHKDHDRSWSVRRNEGGHKSQNSQHPKRKSKGRGPSGIPYGYSRPVDSYYPN